MRALCLVLVLALLGSALAIEQEYVFAEIVEDLNAEPQDVTLVEEAAQAMPMPSNYPRFVSSGPNTQAPMVGAAHAYGQYGYPFSSYPPVPPPMPTYLPPPPYIPQGAAGSFGAPGMPIGMPMYGMHPSMVMTNPALNNAVNAANVGGN